VPGQYLDVSRALHHAYTQHGTTLAAMSREDPLLIVFLRHFGCPFCRETIADVAQVHAQLAEEGARIAFVHMASEPEAEQFLRGYGMGDAARVSDPGQWLYRAFCLRRGGPLDLIGPGVWKRGLEALRGGHGFGLPVGDPLQMPGIFLVYREEIVQEYRHKTAGDRPDYLWLAARPVPFS
jgi:thiol-disulfide isomerase/thioredoxin